ncbi:MAG: PAS domain-containing protein [Deltaproteobacteria bacterium]
MTLTRWDDLLVAEHEMIERSMAVLKHCLENIDETIKRPRRIVRSLDFLLEFGDKIHNKKEEDFLFPLMEKRGIPTAGGPIGVMLLEHKMERELLRTMLTKVSFLASSPPDKRQEFCRKGFEYLQIRAEHIWKENDILYAMARKVFTDHDNTNLLDSFEDINKGAYGDNAGEKFDQMLKEIEAGDEANKRGLIRNLSYDEIEGIMEALPFEVTFVDAADTVAYFNRLDREKLFPRTRSVIGRKVEKCHPEKSVSTVQAIVEGFKNRTRDKAEFWIDFRNDKILIRYLPVYGRNEEYLGVLEVTQAIGAIQQLTWLKRLLD